MTVFEALNSTERSGAMKVLVAKGFLSPKASFYMEIFLLFDKQVRLGVKKMNAYQNTAEELDIHIDTVRKAVRLMAE